MSLAGVVALAALAAWMWVVGSALARGRPAAERVANGALAACALAWTAMACGALGIGILGSTAITGGVALVAAAAALARRPPLRSARPVVAPLIVGCAAGLLLAGPGLLRPLDALRPSRNDMVWHTAWVHQLSAGFSSPGGVYAGEPNSYPWLFHSLVAWIAAALPGGTVDAFQVLELFGLVCAGVGMWLLARELGACNPEATWSVGLFLTAAAFGWASRADFQFEMPALELGPFHGDPVPALTPALAYLPPMIPRDLGLALAPIVLWLAMCAARGPERMWWRAGFAGGLVFLAAPPAGIFCALWVVTIAVVERRWGIWRAALAWVAATSVWLVPLAIAYHRYHGFVPIAHLRLTEPNATQTLVALGISLPLGLAGLFLLARSRPQMATRAIVLVAIPAIAVLLGASISQLSTLVAHGVPTPLVRWLRYLPFLVLALCVPAGVAANALVTVLSRRARPVAIAAAGAGDRRGRGLDGPGVCDGLARARPLRVGVFPPADRRPHTPRGARPRAGCRLPRVDAVRTHRREPLRHAAAAGQGALPHVAARPRARRWPQAQRAGGSPARRAAAARDRHGVRPEGRGHQRPWAGGGVLHLAWTDVGAGSAGDAVSPRSAVGRR